jgi:hypothetical protein
MYTKSLFFFNAEKCKIYGLEILSFAMELAVKLQKERNTGFERHLLPSIPNNKTVVFYVKLFLVLLNYRALTTTDTYSQSKRKKERYICHVIFLYKFRKRF